MKSLALVFGLASLLAAPAVAQSSTWNIDAAHSEVDFATTHMMVSKVHGRVGGLKGAIQLDEKDISKSTVSLTLDVSTIDTGVGARDTDIKGASWFDVAKFPTATFTSTQVTGAGKDLHITGNLTLHGVTKPVELDAQGPTGPAPGMDHKPHAGFSATGTINRKDFGIGANFPEGAVSNEVKLTIDLEVVKQ